MISIIIVINKLSTKNTISTTNQQHIKAYKSKTAHKPSKQKAEHVENVDDNISKVT